jgi:hypothetical protein
MMDYRTETNKRLQKLLALHIPLKEIADLLNAEEFLSYQEMGGGKPPLVEFSAQKFIDREIKKEHPLQLPIDLTKIKEVVLPPDKGEIIQKGKGESIEKKQHIPRSRYLVEVLSELRYPYSVVEGVNRPTMMRQESYKVFIIPALEKLVLVNDEEENATFVIHRVADPLKEWPEYAEMTKDEMKSLGKGKTTIIHYSGSAEDWKVEVKNSLITSPLEKKVFEKAPEGWRTNSSLATEFGIDFYKIKRIANECLTDHPEWKKMYADTVGKLAAHYHPRLVDSIREKINEHSEKASDGWFSAAQLAKEFGSSPRAVKKMAEKYREKKEWFKMFRGASRSQEWEHFHPDLVAILKAELNEFVQNPPEGWQMIKDIAVVLRASEQRIKNEISKYRTTNPEWFKRFRGETKGKPGEYVHPQLIEIIKVFLKRSDGALFGNGVKTDDIPESSTFAPADWTSNRPLAVSLGIHKKTTKNIADTFRAEHPEWFKSYINRTGHVSEHYHPDLAKEIAKVVNNRGTPAPEGWKTAANLAEELGVVWGKIEKKIKPFLTSHPEWFGEYLDGIKRKRQHFHPDLVAIIKKDLGK